MKGLWPGQHSLFGFTVILFSLHMLATQLIWKPNIQPLAVFYRVTALGKWFFTDAGKWSWRTNYEYISPRKALWLVGVPTRTNSIEDYTHYQNHDFSDEIDFGLFVLVPYGILFAVGLLRRKQCSPKKQGMGASELPTSNRSKEQ
jgi:hypothetical protein